SEEASRCRREELDTDSAESVPGRGSALWHGHGVLRSDLEAGRCRPNQRGRKMSTEAFTHDRSASSAPRAPRALLSSRRVLVALAALGLLASCAALAVESRAEQSQPVETVTPPAKGAIMPPAYIETVARATYVWAWPLVNMTNRRSMITKAPEPGRLND